MERFEEVLKEKRIIKQFNKKGNQLIHHFSPNGTNKSGRELCVYLYTLGHLWLYVIFEETLP